jgi:hypothetical protein
MSVGGKLNKCRESRGRGPVHTHASIQCEVGWSGSKVRATVTGDKRVEIFRLCRRPELATARRVEGMDSHVDSALIERAQTSSVTREMNSGQQWVTVAQAPLVTVRLDGAVCLCSSAHSSTTLRLFHHKLIVAHWLYTI